MKIMCICCPEKKAIGTYGKNDDPLCEECRDEQEYCGCGSKKVDCKSGCNEPDDGTCWMPFEAEPPSKIESLPAQIPEPKKMEAPIPPCPTYDSVIQAKKLTDAKLKNALATLKRFKPTDDSPRCFAGNPILYHFMLDALCRVKLKNGSFKDMMDSDELRNDTWIKANHYAKGSRENNLPMRLFELWRRMNGAIVFFKPTTAMYVYKKYNATSVLDPCAGWGGRMLAAWALDIKYLGYDTNPTLQYPYNDMMALLNKGDSLRMLWTSSLTSDFSDIDYDFVLTSPPYINVEVYPGMTPFESKAKFYKEFLIPLIDKCRKNIKRGGKVCFNISPAMYKDLTEVFKYEKASDAINLLQQKVQGKDKGDKIYVW